MPKSKQDLKTKLMQEAEAVIDELLAWHLEADQPNLGQIEAKVLDLRQRLSEQMSQAVIANQEAVPRTGVQGVWSGNALQGHEKDRRKQLDWGVKVRAGLLLL